MAYMSQERKSQIAPTVKAVLKKYGVKGSLSVRNHSTLVLNIKSGRIDFVENYIKADRPVLGRQMSAADIARLREGRSLDVNPYWYHEHFTGKALSFLKEVFAAMNRGNHNNSDIQTDYFDVGWYVNVNIGKWNQPYTVE